MPSFNVVAKQAAITVVALAILVAVAKRNATVAQLVN